MKELRVKIEALPVQGYVNGLHNGKTCLHPEPTKHFGGTVLWESPLISRAEVLRLLDAATPALPGAPLLSDEQIHEIESHIKYVVGRRAEYTIAFARAIEQAVIAAHQQPQTASKG